MPTYDYRCAACGFELELFQSIREAPKRKCPQCGKPKLERLIGTGGGIIFKGSGFYETDYRSDSYRKGAEADAPKSESKAESKPKSETGPAQSAKKTKKSE